MCAAMLGTRSIGRACQQLHLRLRLDGQSPQLDEAERALMVEGVAALVGRQRVLVERVWRAAAHHGAVATAELEAYLAGDEALRAMHERHQVGVERAVPQAVVDQLRISLATISLKRACSRLSVSPSSACAPRAA